MSTRPEQRQRADAAGTTAKRDERQPEGLGSDELRRRREDAGRGLEHRAGLLSSAERVRRQRHEAEKPRTPGSVKDRSPMRYPNIVESLPVDDRRAAQSIQPARVNHQSFPRVSAPSLHSPRAVQRPERVRAKPAVRASSEGKAANDKTKSPAGPPGSARQRGIHRVPPYGFARPEGRHTSTHLSRARRQPSDCYVSSPLLDRTGSRSVSASVCFPCCALFQSLRVH